MKPQDKHRIIIIIAAALAIKLVLFIFVVVHAPQGKFLPDSTHYLNLASTLESKGAFAVPGKDEGLIYEIFRTPGYPLFLAIFNGLLKVPLDGIVLIQIASVFLTAFIVYKTAIEIDPHIALLSMVIILFDPPITIFSLTILTETLFLLLISFFMFNFVLYLKYKKPRFIVLSALLLVAATYVRPISYYLGIMLTFFIIYAGRKENLKRGLAHAVIFILMVYSLLGVWQARNYIMSKNMTFSPAGKHNLSCMGLFHSYSRNKDPHTKGMAPLPYYINVSSRCLMSLMTRPGSFKYFKSETLKIAGCIFGYPWMIFWLFGFIAGSIKAKGNIYIQFMLFITLYFIVTSIGGLMWNVSERLRVPMMSFIAMVSAYGWNHIFSCFKSNFDHDNRQN